MRELKTIIVHHSASSRKTTVEQVDKWHRDRGFSGIGYHFFVDGNAVAHVGRPLSKVGAHARGFNSDSVGICGAGDNTVSGREWTDEQMVKIGELCRSLMLVFPTITEVIGHKDVGATLCPGLDVAALLKTGWMK